MWHTVWEKENISLYFQTQISTASWPSDGYWPKLLDKYNFTIYNWTFNYNEYIDYVMSEKNTDEIQQNIDLMRNYVKNNYVKVGKVKMVFEIFVNEGFHAYHVTKVISHNILS